MATLLSLFLQQIPQQHERFSPGDGLRAGVPGQLSSWPGGRLVGTPAGGTLWSIRFRKECILRPEMAHFQNPVCVVLAFPAWWEANSGLPGPYLLSVPTLGLRPAAFPCVSETLSPRRYRIICVTIFHMEALGPDSAVNFLLKNFPQLYC